MADLFSDGWRNFINAQWHLKSSSRLSGACTEFPRICRNGQLLRSCLCEGGTSCSQWRGQAWVGELLLPFQTPDIAFLTTTPGCLPWPLVPCVLGLGSERKAGTRDLASPGGPSSVPLLPQLLAAPDAQTISVRLLE